MIVVSIDWASYNSCLRWGQSLGKEAYFSGRRDSQLTSNKCICYVVRVIYKLKPTRKTLVCNEEESELTIEKKNFDKKSSM